MSDGKQLEKLVAFVEQALLPAGFDVKTNSRVFNDDGHQIAEFDIEITGKVGSTVFSWLIECRDRPGSGPAPGSWIEQLVGRRDRFGFNKVTAVSTTGFAAGAIDYARDAGIELRDVKDLSPGAFHWLVGGEMRFVKNLTIVERAMLLIDNGESEDRREALSSALKTVPADAAFLKSSKTGEMVTAAAAFSGAVSGVGSLFDTIQPNGPAQKIKLHAEYPADDDHFTVDTEKGEIRILAIDFEGELRVEEALVPITTARRYEHSENGEAVSQLAAFAPQEMFGNQYALELHRMGENGETHVILRRV